ncbi:hypothetical protein QP932_10415 [Corynebacterium freneyi]|nr:hypothetical protein [Corynebacterium freneyi]MDK8768903.1 hypothetical protein [Corynebacterium freneyi]
MRLPITETIDPDLVTGAERDRALARRISIGDMPTRSAATSVRRRWVPRR